MAFMRCQITACMSAAIWRKPVPLGCTENSVPCTLANIYEKGTIYWDARRDGMEVSDRKIEPPGPQFLKFNRHQHSLSLIRIPVMMYNFNEKRYCGLSHAASNAASLGDTL